MYLSVCVGVCVYATTGCCMYVWMYVFMQLQGVEIVSTPDQNATDFTKCLQLVIERLQRNETKVLVP